MAAVKTESLSTLFEQDETAWLEIMADLVSKKRFKEIDHRNLSEYLTDMAIRDRREVKSRLVMLLSHLLKWQFQIEGAQNPGMAPFESNGFSCRSCWRVPP
jgi:hypothetical protein